MNWYLTLTRGKQILIAVFMTHLFFLLMLGADHWMHRSRVEHKKLHVHTFIATSPKPVITAPAKTQTTTPPKQTQPKKTAPPKLSAKKEESLLSEIEKNLNSLTVTPSTKKTNIEIPTFHESQPQVNDSSIAEEIAALLQETLELPEFGEVKIKLSINRFGVLQNLEILEAKSQKNGEFLKKRLPEVQFPCLNEVTTLTIVFSNAF